MTDEQITETDVDEAEGVSTDDAPDPQNSGNLPKSGNSSSSDADELEDEPEEKGKGNSEAAKWRVKLREAEAERDALKARVGDMQAAEVSRLATGPGRLHDGADLLLSTRLDDLLDDEGDVDEDKVAEAVTALVERKPHLAKPAYDGGVGIGEKGTTGGASWADVIGS